MVGATLASSDQTVDTVRSIRLRCSLSLMSRISLPNIFVSSRTKETRGKVKGKPEIKLRLVLLRISGEFHTLYLPI
jgi:hypothetical protein